MQANEYQALALRTEADQQKILDRLVQLGPQAMRLDNAVRGLANDTGEVCNSVKNYIEYGKPLDVSNLMEELGDCCWRIAQACAATGITFEEVLKANVRKLQVRYPQKYSDAQADPEARNKAAEMEAVVGERRTMGEVVKPAPRYGNDSTLDELHAVQKGEVDMTAYPKVCTNCGKPATRWVRDTSRDGKREEIHGLCRAHNRVPNVLPNS